MFCMLTYPYDSYQKQYEMYNERQMFSHKINRVFTCILPRNVLRAFKKSLKEQKWGIRILGNLGSVKLHSILGYENRDFGMAPRVETQSFGARKEGNEQNWPAPSHPFYRVWKPRVRGAYACTQGVRDVMDDRILGRSIGATWTNRSLASEYAGHTTVRRAYEGSDR